jgi:hypothetical protein
MKLRSLIKDASGVFDITVAITVGIVFAALMIISYIIWTLRAQLIRPGAGVTPASLNNSVGNITAGFDQTVKIIIIAILVAVLAIALSYLMMLRSGA